MVLAAVFSLLLPPPTSMGTSPEATVRSVIDGLNQRNADTLVAAYQVVGPNAKGALNRLFVTGMRETGPVYVVDSVYVTETGGSATAKVKVSVKGQSANVLPEELVKLVKINGDWKISNREVAKAAPQSLFSGLGAFLVNPQALELQARTAASATVVLSNMKQIATAAIIYAGDSDDKILLSTANLKTKLLPYLKNAEVFKGTDGKPLPLVFNSNLTGKDSAAVRNPAQTVMISLGGKGKLVFTDDRTPIAFVDGHAKYIKRADAASLNWNP